MVDCRYIKNDGTGKVSFISESLDRYCNEPNFEDQAFHIKSVAMQIFAGKNIIFQQTYV